MYAIRSYYALVPFLPLFLLSVLPAQGGEGRPAAAPESLFPVTLSTFEPTQGEPVLVEVSPLPRADSVVMIWKGQKVPMKKA